MTDPTLEERVRLALQTQADPEPLAAETAPLAASRARRRLAQNGFAVAMVIIVTVAGSITAVRSLGAPATRQPVSSVVPRPSPHDRIVFSEGRDLYSVAPDGTELRKLTDCSIPQCGYPLDPARSPDGTQIVFTRGPDKFDPVGDLEGPLLVMNADGSNLHKLTGCQLPSCQDAEPTWSPDGSRIAFVRSGPDGGVFVIGADGSSPLRISGAGGRLPAWSPDGTRLSISVSSGGGEGLLVANADGSGVRTLHQGPSYSGPFPSSWSPDGSRIAYLETPSVGRGFVAAFHMVGADGSNDHIVYRSKCCLSGWFGPRWSPTGADLALGVNLRPAGTGARLLVLDPTGRHVSEVGSGNALAWSPDGTRVVANDGGRLTVIDVQGPSTHVIARGVVGTPTW
jgi:Tol biopolymer transport system component